MTNISEIGSEGLDFEAGALDSEGLVSARETQGTPRSPISGAMLRALDAEAMDMIVTGVVAQAERSSELRLRALDAENRLGEALDHARWLREEFDASVVDRTNLRAERLQLSALNRELLLENASLKASAEARDEALAVCASAAGLLLDLAAADPRVGHLLFKLARLGVAVTAAPALEDAVPAIGASDPGGVVIPFPRDRVPTLPRHQDDRFED